MNRTLRLPKERVLALDPAGVQDYLEKTGWEIDRQNSNVEAKVYHFPADPSLEILLPRDRSFADYALRLTEVLQTIGAIEGRTAWEVLEDFSGGPRPTSVNGPAVGPRRDLGTKRVV